MKSQSVMQAAHSTCDKAGTFIGEFAFKEHLTFLQGQGGPLFQFLIRINAVSFNLAES